MGQVIMAIEQVTTAWLSDILKQPVSDIHIEPITGGYEGKWLIRASSADGSIQRLFLKIATYTREARFYQAMRDNPAGVPIVLCYDVGMDDENAHILLQDLSQTHEARPPSQFPPNGRECEAIIDGLADLHAYWWNSPRLDTTFGGALSGAALRQNYAEDIEQFPAFADFLGDRLSPQRRSIYERVGSRLTDLMVHRFAQGDLTLVFEDVHSGNFLYPRKPDDKLYFIDWEQWGINLAMNDLAYMMALFWSPERRSRLETPYLKRYHERITAKGIRYSWDALWHDYRLCVMYFLFRPVLQWSRRHHIDVWWNHFERITAAYLDLNCDELLG
jgi:thiamine kinase-like enzyme